LVAARLEADALALAREEMAEGEAIAFVASIRAQLPERVRRIAPIEDPYWKPFDQPNPTTNNL